MSNLRKRENPFEKKDAPEKSEQDQLIARNGDFANFELSAETAENLKANGFKYLFPIQQATFKDIFAGKDLIGRDRTGSGKTLAFALPLLEQMRRQSKYFNNQKAQKPFILVLVPTRELAIQVTREFEKLRNTKNEFRILSIYGGTDIQAQIYNLRAGTEVIVGTPGRVMDLQDRKELVLSKVKAIVLDETDQMLNFGFQEDIERILKNAGDDLAVEQRRMDEIQFLLFSATIPRWVEKISGKFMKPDVARIDMVQGSENMTSMTVEHLCISFSDKNQKISSIGDVVMVYGGAHSRTIIFTDTKEEANTIMLNGQLKIDMQVLHGDIPQNQREVTFKSFKAGKLKCLVATNVAARGLDIPEIDLVIQLSPPKEVDSYIHRSGRTGRAGKSGVCITFYTSRERDLIDKIEQAAGVKLKKVGMPQPEDIVRASARDMSHSFKKVSDQVLDCFTESVQDILELYKPEEALCRALAIISGYTSKLQQRSLLSSVEGFVTYVMENSQEASSLTPFWNFLQSNFPSQLAESIKTMKFLSNRMGAAFDLQDVYKKQFGETIEKLDQSVMKIYIAKELPDMDDKDLNNSYSKPNDRRGGFRDKSKGDYGYGRSSYNEGGRGGFGDSKDAYNGNGKGKYPDSGRGSYGGNKGGFDNSRGSNNDNKWGGDSNQGGFGDHKGGSDNNKGRSNGNGYSGGYDSGKGYGQSHGGNDTGKGNGQSYGDNKQDPNVDETQLFVGNLGDAEQRDLQDFLDSKGFRPDDVYVVKNQDGGSRGFGYVRFSDPVTAKAAMDELSWAKIAGRQLRVNYANKKKS